jgi:hypothetical protein
MRATEAISALKELVDRHGDLEITVAISTHEYSLISPNYNGAGPSPNIADLQPQTLDERFVFESKDDLPVNQNLN